MAYTAVLEREIVNKNETKQRETALAEAKHTANRHEAYVRSFGTGALSAATQVLERPVAAPARANQPKAYESITLSPEKKSRALFMDYDYRDGMLINRSTASPVDVLVREPAATAAPVAEVAAVPAPAQADEDDAIPTRRTMETLLHASAAQEKTAEEEKTGFFASLSTKAKVVLLAIVTAVVLAFIVICINTAIINSINSDIANLRGKVNEQQETYSMLSEEKESLEDPESTVVAEWAQEHGMTREP